MFLLATMTIVEILNNNGCFDFVRQLLRTRSSKKMLWTLAIVTFLISINLDNLTTTVMMLTMMAWRHPEQKTENGVWKRHPRSCQLWRCAHRDW